MTIIDEVNRIKSNIANAYTACESKGATIPENANSNNLQETIESISAGSGEKYGVTAEALLGDVDSDGVLQPSTKDYDVVFTGVRDIGYRTLYYGFLEKNIKSLTFPDATQITGNDSCYNMCQYCKNLQSVSFPNLITIAGSYAFRSAFNGCTSLTSINFPKLETISKAQACNGMFQGCSALTTIEFPELTTIAAGSSQACYNMFRECYNLTTADFPKLANVFASSSLLSMFQSCSKIEHVYFRALNTSSFTQGSSQFNSLLSSTGSSVTHTLHFPSNMESTIATLSGYPNFGGTSGYVVLAFDLPATS